MRPGNTSIGSEPRRESGRTRPHHRLVRLLLAWCSAIPLAACPDDPCAPPQCPIDYEDFDPWESPASLEQDVMPVVQRSCSLSSCHGDPDRPDADLYLGPPASEGAATPDDRLAFVARVVGVASQTAPERPLVTAGDPGDSFLMHKLDGCHTELGLSCTSQDPSSSHACGESMPRLAPLLCSDDRDAFRWWIAQGAQNN